MTAKVVEKLREVSRATHEAADALQNAFNNQHYSDGDLIGALAGISDTSTVDPSLVTRINFEEGVHPHQQPANTSTASNGTGATEEEGPKKKRAKRAPADPNAPKKPQTLYLLFTNSRRKEIKEDLDRKGAPPLSHQQLTELVADEWKRMTDEMKLPYIEIYKTRLQEYQHVKAEYEKTKRANGTFVEPAKRSKKKKVDEAVPQGLVPNLVGNVQGEIQNGLQNVETVQGIAGAMQNVQNPELQHVDNVVPQHAPQHVQHVQHVQPLGTFNPELASTVLDTTETPKKKSKGDSSDKKKKSSEKKKRKNND